MLYVHKEGISFKKVDHEDLPFLLSLKEESWWGTHRISILNKEDQERWFSTNTDIVMIAWQGSNRVGVCIYSCLDWISRHCHMSGSIAKTSRDITNICFMTGVDFCFEILNMHRFTTEVASFNQILALDLSLGMQIEGVKREEIYRCGKYYDSVMLGCLKHEWEKTDRVINYGGICNTNFNVSIAKNIVKFNNRFIKKLVNKDLK